MAAEGAGDLIRVVGYWVLQLLPCRYLNASD